MWSLKSPEALFLYLLLPVFIYLAHLRKERGGILKFNFNIWDGAAFSGIINVTRILHIFSWVLFWFGVFSLIFALSGPMIIKKDKIFLTKGIDLIIVLDESPSMSAEDFKPVNRFTSAKKVIKDFTLSRENDQIGLVTFSTEAILRVPPTMNYDRIFEVLESLQIMELGDGTAIGKGIAVAALHLRTSKAKEKVIILLTDGVNNKGKILPEEAARLAYELGIRIYTIGIGKESDKSWQFKNPQTGKVYEATSGEFDEKLLVKIAGLSGGKYFYAGKLKTLSNIFEEIDSIEKTEKRMKISVTRNPLHKQFILAGFFIILLSFILRKWVLKEIF